MSKKVAVLSVLLVANQFLLFGQGIEKGELLSIADANRRSEVISKLGLASADNVAQLLLWSRNPPPNIDEHELRVGLAEAFGRLRTPESVPFLVENIALRRSFSRPIIGLKSELTTMSEYPAMGALIEIGADAVEMVGTRLGGACDGEERLLGIMVLSKIGGVKAKEILRVLKKQADSEVTFIDRGLSDRVTAERGRSKQ